MTADDIGMCVAFWVVSFAVICIYAHAEKTTKSCADAAVSSDPPKWWLRELELAKGRKAAKEIDDDRE